MSNRWVVKLKGWHGKMIEIMKISDFKGFKNPPGRVLELLQLHLCCQKDFCVTTQQRAKIQDSTG